MSEHAVTIRRAMPHDADALGRLAALDGRAALRGAVVLGALDGVPIAAVALSSGAVVADPFHATAETVRRLRLRRYQLLRQGGDAGPAWSLLRRLAPVPAG